MNRTLLNADNYAVSILAHNDTLVDMLKEVIMDKSREDNREFKIKFMYEYIKGEKDKLTLNEIIDFFNEQGL